MAVDACARVRSRARAWASIHRAAVAAAAEICNAQSTRGKKHVSLRLADDISSDDDDVFSFSRIAQSVSQSEIFTF